MEKLLLLGNNCHVDELIKCAKERGIYTIVSDNYPVEKSPEKAMADEAWDISVLDIDALETKCNEHGVSAVLCGASEVCLGATRDLCKRLHLPFYASDKTWDITNNKNELKKTCVKVGLNVPKGYSLDMNFTEEDLDEIKYPVVVKPVDGCSSIGLHICNDEKELIAGYKDAYEKSKIKSVVVEEFVLGEQLGLIYVFHDGVSTLVMSGDDVADKRDNQRRVFGFAPTKHQRLYEDKIRAPLMKLFDELGCKEGVGCLQIITNGEKYYVIEMNYRLPGGKNPAEHIMCNNMLNSVFPNKCELKFADIGTRKAYGYVIWLKPGIIGKIDGLDKIKELLPNAIIQPLKRVGDFVESNSGMRQIFSFGLLKCDLEEYDTYVETINKHLIILSDIGEDMFCRYRYDRSGYATLE